MCHCSSFHGDFSWLVVQPFLKKMAQSSVKGGEAKQTVLLETLQNIETVKSISGAEKLRRRWLDAVDEQAEVNVKTKFYNQIATSFSSTALMSELKSSLYLTACS